MSVAYVDTSMLTAIAFDESGTEALARRVDDFESLTYSNLLEAELRSVFAPEQLPFPESTVAVVEWILPDRSLAAEFATVLRTGHLRGADLWHVATALFVSPGMSDLWFATLDVRQNAVAADLGFPVACLPDRP